VLRTRADLRFTYANILTLWTHFAEPAQNERRFFTAKRTYENVYGYLRYMYPLAEATILNLVLLVDLLNLQLCVYSQYSDSAQDLNLVPCL
jgi:hypothetical protein